jgi:hypothetical protein
MEATMIRTRTSIGGACSQETSKYAIGAFLPVRTQTKDMPAWLVATDGHILACAPCDLMDGPCVAMPLIPADAGRKINTLITVSGTITTTAPGRKGKTEVHTAVEGSMPPIHEVIPLADENTEWITFDPELLLRLAKAIVEGDNKGVSLGIRAPNKPILVLDSVGEGLGVIMPINPSVDRDSKVEQKALLSAEFNKRRTRFVADVLARS